MFYNAKNGTVDIGNTEMEYITFGSGEKNVILIPGLGDGLRTVKGKAVPFACLYHEFAQGYTVYCFSRKNELEENYTTRHMARDLKIAMDKLGIAKADIIGVSQGGMISQFLAIDYQEVVGKLVLAVTAPCANETIEKVVGDWIRFAEDKNYYDLTVDTAEKMYTEDYLKKYRKVYPLLTRLNTPKNPERFLIMAKACITHNAFDELDKIKAPTFIVGAEKDLIVTGDASRTLAERIVGSELFMYEDFGHGVFEEAKEFNQRVRDFLVKQTHEKQ